MQPWMILRLDRLMRKTGESKLKSDVNVLRAFFRGYS